MFYKLKRLFAVALEKLLKKNRVYYINGSETLPPPLSSEEEEEMIENISDTAARDKLIVHNLRLVVYIAKRFENTGAGIEELISIGTVGLVKSISTFNKEKNIRLATYASRCIENEILMFLRKNNKLRVEISFDEPLNIDYDGNELLLQDILTTNESEVQDNLEFNELSLPRPDKTLFLDMPVDVSLQLARARAELKNGQTRDIFEEDSAHMRQAYNNAKYVAKKFNWEIIDCYDKKLKSIEEIHKEKEKVALSLIEPNLIKN